jgi:hypothetical protein
MFCALVVLVLFVMALAIEVSERVRAELVQEEPIAVVETAELSEMTKEEVAELSRQLQEQQNKNVSLQARLERASKKVAEQRKDVESTIAALNGEQRFTGARESASFNMAYDYDSDRLYFVPARECNDANRRRSGESALEYRTRQTRVLVDVALAARKQRGFTLNEAKAIYQGFTKYKEVIAEGTSYRVVDSDMGISYSTLLCGFIAGDENTSELQRLLITKKLLEVYEVKGAASEEMYPQVEIVVDVGSRATVINGIKLGTLDLKEILLSIEGRGAMLDLEGLSGAAPEWLREGALVPSGYISKTPKVPAS